MDGGVIFTVTDVPGRERFEACDEDGVLAGVLTYQLTGPIVAFTHTRPEPAFAGQGVEPALARAAMDDALARARTVVPLCPFLSGWLAENPKYEKVVARSTRKVR